MSNESDLAEYVVRIMRTAAQLQKVSADNRDLTEVYRLALEIKVDADQVKRWALMRGKEPCLEP